MRVRAVGGRAVLLPGATRRCTSTRRSSTNSKQKLGGSKAEFSQAYVIAHEIGHHVQNLLGYSARVDAKRGTRQENEYSVRLELQADYLAGVWAHQANKKFNFIEPGDVESAITIGEVDRRRPYSRSDRAGSSTRRSSTTARAAQRVDVVRTPGFRTGDASQAKLDQFFTVVRFDPSEANSTTRVFR